MERLTEVEHGTAMVKDCGSNCKYGFEYCRKEDWENCKTINDVIDKLAQYETLDEQGLLLRLPVKVGDTIYTIRYGKENNFVVVETKIIEIRQNVNGIFFEPLISRKAYKIDDFGKEVFLTKSEAEQKLKEMESD